MKKIIISLLTCTLLVMSGFAQNYEYTGKKFVQYFDDSQVDKTGVFSWTKTQGGTFSVNENELSISRAFIQHSEITLDFDSVNLDISEVPYVTFEAKADVDSLLVIQLKDGSGNFTSTQHKTYLSSEWETYSFKFYPGIWGETDITDIATLSLYRFNKASIDGKLYLRYIAVGDTSVAFGPTQFDLNASATAGGSITLDPPGGTYDSSTVVTVTAVADSGYSFLNWSGASSATTESIDITMDADKSITANFVSGSTSMNEAGRSSNINLFPIPAQEILYISGIEGIQNVAISDLTGKTLLQVNGNNIQEINISALNPGMYVITCNNGQGALNKLFIKK